MATVDIMIYSRMKLWLKVFIRPLSCAAMFAIRMGWTDSTKASRFMYDIGLRGLQWRIGKKGQWRNIDRSRYEWEAIEARQEQQN